MSHASMAPEQRAEAGITDDLIRLSVGIESTDDLTRDLDQALAAARTSRANSEPEAVPVRAEP
jgi:cystathionine beta-lyase/cystathionine gamma-synthase